MTRQWTYVRGAAAPGIFFPWFGAGGVDIDFTSGWTFTAELVARRDGTVILNAGVVTGETGGVNWDPRPVNGLVPATLDLPEGTTYNLRISATETATGRRRDLRPKNPPRIGIAVGSAP